MAKKSFKTNIQQRNLEDPLSVEAIKNAQPAPPAKKNKLFSFILQHDLKEKLEMTRLEEAKKGNIQSLSAIINGIIREYYEE